MSSLADIFAAVRLQLDGTGFEAQATALADKQGRNVGDRMSANLSASFKKIGADLQSLTTTQGFKSVVTGVGMGVGIAAWGQLANAVQQVPAALLDMARAAAADETSQNKLYTSIAANTTAWDGNREAIEKVIKERMALSFADEEQRDSLALLVARTGDVNEALRIQRIAMDLARLKGISLAESSKALAMALGGQGRALKELGINVGDMTDKTEALGAVQEKAAGQAVAYADSSEGAFAALQITMDELGETIGYALLPALKKLAVSLREDVLPNLDKVGTGIDALSKAFDLLKLPQQVVIDNFGRAQQAVQAFNGDQEALIALLRSMPGPFSDVADDLEEQRKAVSAGAGAWGKFSEGNATAIKGLKHTPGRMAAVEGAADDLRDSLKDAAAAWDLLNSRIRRDNEFANLPDKITVAADDVKTAQKELGAAIDKGNKVAIAAARIRLRNAQAELAELRREWAQLRVEMERGVKVGRTYHPPTAPGGRPMALGGPVYAGHPYIVGEIRPEVFVPNVNGTILPSIGGATINMGGITVNAGSDTSLGAARRFGQAVLDEVAAGLREQSARLAGAT